MGSVANHADNVEGRAMEGFQLQGSALRASGGCTPYFRIGVLTGA